MSDVSTPVVGQGATAHSHGDSYPYVVFAVSADGREVVLIPLKDVDEATGHEPARNSKGFPVWDHVYTDEELVSLREEGDWRVRAHRDAEGRFHSTGGARIVFGQARFFRDCSS